MPENEAAPWKDFPPEAYWHKHYSTLRPDDHKIMKLVRKFFAAANVSNGIGIDAGSGPNLYPSLSMLPYCQRITLLDYSSANVEWLERELKAMRPEWKYFWDVLLKQRDYRGIQSYPEHMGDVARVEYGSLMHLEPKQFDIGTMFFVAESCTSKHIEFVRAVQIFVRSLKPNAPFAIAFIRKSEGYEVGGVHFPAVAIDSDQVNDCLKAVAQPRKTKIRNIKLVDPFRTGYKGMMLATGYAAPS